MKKIISLLCAGVLISAFCMACDDKDRNDAPNILSEQQAAGQHEPEQQGPEQSEPELPEPGQQEPREGSVPYTILFKDTMSPLRGPYLRNVTLIDTPEELEALKGLCARIESTIPEVDFSEQTMLVACGAVNYGIHKLEVTGFEQLSANEYTLNVDVTLNCACVCPVWTVVLVTDKLDSQSEVALNMTVR